MISYRGIRIMHKTVFLSLALYLSILGIGYAAEIQVSVDRNPVNLNDSFQIIFSSQASPDGSPDFAPLEENFEILNRQHGSTASWSNGESSRTEQWVLQVMAKHSGDLLIPPIAFGADSSKPISVKVTEEDQSAKPNDELFLEVQASPEQPYVQSQVLLTVKIFRRVQIVQATLSEPEIKDAVIEKLTEDNTYSTQVNHVDYVVTERKYAIFPQQSGVFSIAPLTLVAQVQDASGQAGIYGFFNRRALETKRVSSKAITLNVLPAPSQQDNGNWLSAEALELSDQWSDDSLQVTVGEPLTRTLTLTAKAATVGQLPELVGSTGIDGIKIYPDQPQLREDKSADGLSAFRQEKLAYIANAAGEFKLPAIQIDWFNSKTGKRETARIGEKIIKAMPAAENPDIAPAPANPPVSASAPLVPPAAAAASDDDHFWRWLSALLGLGWATTLLWIFRRSPAVKVEKAPLPVRPEQEAGALEKALKQACAGNDRQQAKQVLLQWGKSQFGCNSLTALANQCPPALAGQITALNDRLYSAQIEDWQGQALWQAFLDHKLRQSAQRKSATATPSALEPLYKLDR